MYRVAGIDVHKKMLAVVVADVASAEGERFERRRVAATPDELRDKVRLTNRLEAMLEEAHLKLSSGVSDLVGVSGRRLLKALAAGETQPEAS